MANTKKINKKEFNEVSQEPFFNKKRIIILCVGLLVSCAFFALTVKVVLSIDFSSLWKQLGAGTDLRPFFLFLLVFYAFLRPLLNSITLLIRIRQLGYRSTFLQNLLYDFTICFLAFVTPANLVCDPYALFWVKSHGISNSKSFCIICSQGILCQTAQVLITLPSFIIISLQYNNFLSSGPEAISVYWLMVIGLSIDILSIGFFCIASFSKNFSYVLSLTFNKIKKILHMKYHTKEQVKEQYLKQRKVTRESIELFKNWKTSSLIVVVQLIIEFVGYAFAYFCIQWLVPEGINLSFWDIFNCANIAVTANKMLPIPGGQISYEWTLKWLLLVSGNWPSSIESDLDNYINNSILVNRFFGTYIPSAIGIGTFIGLTVIQFKTFGKNNRKEEQTLLPEQ